MTIMRRNCYDWVTTYFPRDRIKTENPARRNCGKSENPLRNHPAFSSGFAEISSIRSIGNRERRKIISGNSTRGDNFSMQSRTFSSVFIFIYLHSLQRQLSVGALNASKTGAQINSLPG